MSQNVSPYQGYEPYVYVSFAEENRAYVMAAVSRLRRAGMRVYFSAFGAAPLSDDQIEQRIAAAAGVLAFLSQEALRSHRCRNEWIAAISRKKPLFTVFLEALAMSPVQSRLIHLLPQLPLGAADERERWAGTAAAVPALRPALGAALSAELLPWPDSISEEGSGDLIWTLIRASDSKCLRCLYPSFVLGRSRHSAHYVFAEQSISREHLRLSFWNESWHATHLRDTSVSYLNGSVMEAGREYDLREGDVLSFGSQKLILKQQSAHLPLPYMDINPEAPDPRTGPAASVSLSQPAAPARRAASAPDGAAGQAAPAPAPKASAAGAAVSASAALSAADGTRIELSPLPFTLGRAKACDYSIRVKTVSSRHARIAREGTQYTLEDLDSTNGTWLNGERLTPGKAYPLKNGDDIRLHEECFRFEAS